MEFYVKFKIFNIIFGEIGNTILKYFIYFCKINKKINANPNIIIKIK